MVVREKLKRDEVLHGVLPHSEPPARVNAVHAAQLVQHHIPKPRLVRRQTSSPLGAHQLVGDVRDVGVSHLQKQRQMPVTKPAQDARVPLEVRHPLRLQQNVVVVQRVRRLVVAVLRQLVHGAFRSAAQPRAQELVRDVDVKVAQLALGLLAVRRTNSMDLCLTRIHRQAFNSRIREIARSSLSALPTIS